MDAIKETLKKLPDEPGVYQYFNEEGKLLYVGKAKNLKNRVRSYWRTTPELKPNPDQSHRIIMMLNEARSIEYIVVETEGDALILENSLIKQLKPKYNILLRDDKTYPYIYLDESQEFPRFELTRKIVKGKHIKYYGPFPQGGRRLLKSIYETLPLVQKKSCLNGKKTCLFYEIKKCLGPCEGKTTKEEYGKVVEQGKKFINDRSRLAKHLEERMMKLAEQERFEEAGELRDRVKVIREMTISSNVDFADKTDLDVFAIENGDDRGVVVKMFMREGKIVSSTHSYFRHTHNFDENEAFKQALLEFYKAEMPNTAEKILISADFEDREQVEKTLSERMGKKMTITSPKSGPKAKLANLAKQNCRELLRIKEDDTIMEQRIADLFELSSFPHRVETFDNSHLMGAATVGGMVVWDEGAWDKKSYRKYELHERDEYGQMREMLGRRIEKFKEEPAPDLWILDGGKANLDLAKKLLYEAGVNLDVIAIAKEKLDAKAHRAKGSARDLVHNAEGVFELKPNDSRLHWVQRQRDEAHRYAITFHQKKKRKDDTQISLLEKKGVGKASLKKLIDYFGTFENIKKADFDEIAKVTNKKVAEALRGD